MCEGYPEFYFRETAADMNRHHRFGRQSLPTRPQRRWKCNISRHRLSDARVGRLAASLGEYGLKLLFSFKTFNSYDQFSNGI